MSAIGRLADLASALLNKGGRLMSVRSFAFAISMSLLLSGASQEALGQIFPGLMADYNGDGVVDTADYAAWKAYFGRDAFFDNIGDGNGDGMVDQADYFIWKSEFGLSLDNFPTGLAGPPRIAIDLIRDGLSRPALDANGNWQFSVAVIPNTAFFENQLDDAPDQGEGSAMAVEFGLQLRDEYGDVHTAVSNLAADVSGQLYENDPGWDGNAVDALGVNNPGVSAFGGLVDSEGLDAVGNQIDAALGTIFLNSDNGGAGHRLFTFSAGRPAMDGNFGGLSIAVDIFGGYGGYYRVAQGNVINDYLGAFDFFAYYVQAGDVNLDGVVGPDDLAILESSLGNAGKWTDGDLTGEGVVDAVDRDILRALLVPEPGSAVMALAVAAALIARRNRLPSSVGRAA
jgi:hypothetical protein